MESNQITVNRRYIKSKNVKYYWSAKKFFKNLMIFIFIITIGIVLVSSTVNGNLESPNRKMIITVLRGETLWSIAKKFKPDTDPRKLINQIKKENSLLSSQLIAGQELILTVEK